MPAIDYDLDLEPYSGYINLVRTDDAEDEKNAERRAQNRRPTSSWATVVLATLAFFAALYVTREIIIPVIFALFLALLFRPLLRKLRRYRIPNAISAGLLIGPVVLLYLLSIWGLADQSQKALSAAPDTIRKVKEMLPQNSGPMQDLREAGKAMEEFTEDTISKAMPKAEQAETNSGSSASEATSSAAMEWTGSLLGSSGYFLGASLIVFVLAYFFLALSDQLLGNAVSLMPSFYEKRSVVELVVRVERGVSKYLGTVACINIGLGVVTGFATWMLGLDNYILWGVMATAFNSIPHIGAFVCMIVLFFVGAIEHESLVYGFLTAGAFALLTAIESYFVTPMILSRSLELSPLAVILAVLFWGWLWGAAGALLAAPILAVAKIICDQFESLHSLGAILGGESKPKIEPSPTQVSDVASKIAAA